jgi:hypothetical protein
MTEKNQQQDKWPSASPMPMTVVPFLFFIPLNREINNCNYCYHDCKKLAAFYSERVFIRAESCTNFFD